MFFVAAAFDGSEYYVLSEPGIVTQSVINNTLALALLHRDYHRYERPLPIGNMNTQLTEFITTKPTKKGVSFKIPFCCNNDFNIDDSVKTPLGIGEVETATFSFRDSMLELELLYNSFEGLDGNDEPVAVFDSVNTFDNTTILIDVLANDTYEPGDIIEIVMPPSIGTAKVVGNKIEFFVNYGSATHTFFTYRIVDATWNVKSNTVSVSINVLAENEPPVANTDNYVAIKDQILSVAAEQGVLFLSLIHI